MEQLKLIIVFFVFFLLALFAVLNPNDVSINFFGWNTPPVSMIVVVFGSVLLGAITAGLLGILTQIKLKNTINRKDREIKDIQDKLVKLDLRLRNYEEKEGPKETEKEAQEGGISSGEEK